VLPHRPRLARITGSELCAIARGVFEALAVKVGFRLHAVQGESAAGNFMLYYSD
jgi:hypothetical protein